MSDQTENPTSGPSPTTTEALRFGPSKNPPRPPRPLQAVGSVAEADQPQPEPTSDPLSTGTESTWPNRDVADHAESALGRVAQGATSSRASTRAAAAELAPMIGTALQAAGVLVHERRIPGGVRETEDGLALLWVPTNDEAQSMALPLARIAARHMPEGVGPDSDWGDALAFTMAAGGFAIGQVQTERTLRAAGAAPVAEPTLEPESVEAPMATPQTLGAQGNPLVW